MNDPADEFRDFDVNARKRKTGGVIVYRGIRHDMPYDGQRESIIAKTKEREAYFRAYDRQYFPSQLPDGSSLSDEIPKKESCFRMFGGYQTQRDRQEFDLYLPKEGGDLSKLVVHVHGGGWHRGKNDVFWRGAPATAAMYASQGIPCVAVTYRTTTPSALSAPVYGLVTGILGGLVISCLVSAIIMLISVIGGGASAWDSYTEQKYIIPWIFAYLPLTLFCLTVFGCLLILWVRPTTHVQEQQDDIIASIRYVQDNAHEWNLTPTQVVLCGHSAGAHLSTYLALEPELMKQARIVPHTSTVVPPKWCKLKGVISISGLYNLRDGPSENIFVKSFFWACYSSGSIGYTSKELFKYSPISLLVRAAVQQHDKIDTVWESAWLNKEVQQHLKRESKHPTTQDTLEVVVPPIYVINAEKDVSIDGDGQNFVVVAKCVSKEAYRSVAKGTTHANIAFDLGRNLPTKWVLGRTMQYFEQ